MFIRGTVGATFAASIMDVPWAASALAATRPSAVCVVRDEKAMTNGLKSRCKNIEDDGGSGSDADYRQNRCPLSLEFIV